jgi:thiamine biosynthesis lipoprotein
MPTLCIVCLLTPAAAGEGITPRRFSFAENHMGTRFAVTVYAKDEAAAKKAAKEAFARVVELNATMSDYLSTSELMRLCAKAGGGPVKVSDDLFRVLSRAQEVSRESDGAFEVTVGPVVRLWRLARRTGMLPDPKRLEDARALVGWRLVELDEKARTVTLRKKGMQLDLGGIGKGFAADEMLKVFRRHGLPSVLIAAGGDVTAGDAPPGKPGWTVAIAPVDAKNEGPRYLTLANASVSTSGDAEQYIEIAGTRYSHIVDPRTGLGLVGRMSATVVAPDGTTADSFTKVVAVLGPKRAFPILEKHKGVSGRYVRKTDGETEVATSPNFPKLRFGAAEKKEGP